MDVIHTMRNVCSRDQMAVEHGHRTEGIDIYRVQDKGLDDCFEKEWSYDTILR